MIAAKIIVGADGWGRPRRIFNEVGNKYGRLEVVKLSRRRVGNRGAFWVCRCSCGRRVTVGGAQLRDGNSTSCGCYRDEIVRKGPNRLPPGEASIRRAIGRARYGATRRNLPWKLTREQAEALMSSPCHYCGALPSNLVRGVNGEFRWNGIDQKTSRAGYFVENCVTCCTACNRLKSDTPYEVFTDRCLCIAANLMKHIAGSAKGEADAINL